MSEKPLVESIKIFTTRGYISPSLLVKKEGVIDNEIEYTIWQEYRMADDPEGEIVRRDVHISVKQQAAAAADTTVP